MTSAVLVILLMLPGGHYTDLVFTFPTMEACQKAIPFARDLAKKEHKPQSPYVMGCMLVRITPKEAI